MPYMVKLLSENFRVHMTVMGKPVAVVYLSNLAIY